MPKKSQINEYSDQCHGSWLMCELALRMQWSRAFSLVCEVALIPLQHWFVEWIGVTKSIDGYLYDHG
jgi:hypothetical protein